MGRESAGVAKTNDQTRRLKVVYRQIEELKLNARNPWRHNRKQIQQLARSIETFGFTVPALIDAEDNGGPAA